VLLGTTLGLAAYGCGSAPAAGAAEVKTGAFESPEPAPKRGEVDPVMVGLWRGYWSPKGCARTERYLLLADGRWQWNDYGQSEAAASTGAVERSGRWWVADGKLVLEELYYQPPAGCGKEPVAGETSSCKEGEGGMVARQPPLVRELELGECPSNREAEAVDSSYLCRSIGGQAFWRHPIPAEPAEPPSDK
jgi:hypothetical protein